MYYKNKKLRALLNVRSIFQIALFLKFIINIHSLRGRKYVFYLRLIQFYINKYVERIWNMDRELNKVPSYLGTHG